MPKDDKHEIEPGLTDIQKDIMAGRRGVFSPGQKRRPTSVPKERSPDQKPPGGPTSREFPTPVTPKVTSQEVEDFNIEMQKKFGQGDSGYFQLNELVFTVPPEQITVQKQIKSHSFPILRAASSQRARTGHASVVVNIPLTFVGYQEVRNKMVPLVYAVRRNPFVFIDNAYLRKMLMPLGRDRKKQGADQKSMMFTVQTVSVQTVENLPTTLQVYLQLLWFNYYPFANDVQYRADWNFWADEKNTGGNPDVRANFPAGSNKQRIAYDMHNNLKNDNLDEAVRLFGQLQSGTKDPRKSEAWSAFIKGATQNQINASDFGIDIPANRMFTLEYEKLHGGANPPEGFYVKDPTYGLYGKLEKLFATDDFIPVHVSVSFANSVTELPLLEQHLPTSQFLGSSDRQCIVTFHCTPAGQKILARLMEMISDYENQVIEHRQWSKEMWMQMWQPIARMCGLEKVVPVGVNIETTPTQPGSSIVRVAFAEWSLIPFPHEIDYAAVRDQVYKSLVQQVFSAVGAVGDNRGVVNVFTGIGTGPSYIGKDEQISGDPAAERLSKLRVGMDQVTLPEEIDFLGGTIPPEGVPYMWLEAAPKPQAPSLSPQHQMDDATGSAIENAKRTSFEPLTELDDPWTKEREAMYAFVASVCRVTHQYPEGLAYATDEESFGLKTQLAISLITSAGTGNPSTLRGKARKLQTALRSIADIYINGDLKTAFPTLYAELKETKRDETPCYPDMDLPVHPISKRYHDTQPDFYIYNPEVIEDDQTVSPSAHQKALSTAKKQLGYIDTIVKEQRFFRPNDVLQPKDEIEYKSKSEPANISSQPGTKHLMHDAIIQPADMWKDVEASDAKVLSSEGETFTITNQTIFDSGIDHMKKRNQLGLRKAFPTFKVYFFREGRDTATLRGFQQMYGGWSVSEIRMIASRKIAADMCVLTLVNVDGFIEVDKLDDIRKDGISDGENRIELDYRYDYFKYDHMIQTQLDVANNKHKTNVEKSIIHKIIEYQLKNPRVNGFGPLGVTVSQAVAATGKTYTGDQLENPETNFAVGVELMCENASNFSKFAGDTYYPEVIAAVTVFPERKQDIISAVYGTADPEKGPTARYFTEETTIRSPYTPAELSSSQVPKGAKLVIDPSYVNEIRDQEVQDFVRLVRRQYTTDTNLTRTELEKQVKDKEKEVSDLETQIEGLTPFLTRTRLYYGTVAVPGQSLIAEEIDGARRRLQELKPELEELKGELRSYVEGEAPGKGVIFQEGTDVLVKLGYSNFAEELDVVFVGHVTESSAGPGTITLLCQTYATELSQEIKGLDDDFTLSEGAFSIAPDVDGPLIAEVALTQPELKHFGRWATREEGNEIEVFNRKDVRRAWFQEDTPVDDNVYLENDPVFDFKSSRFTFNKRTLHQGLQDLAFRYPGYVLGIRPFRDKEWWRNTVFIGRPDFSYLKETPRDIEGLKRRLEEIEDLTFGYDGGSDFAFLFTDVQEELLERAEQREEEVAPELRERFIEHRELFRRYHMITSYHDIIDNGIVLSKRTMYNAVRVKGHDGRFFEKELDGMDPQHMKWLYVENENATKHTGDNMATSMLMWHLKDVYSGEITILGNPSIRPHDICYLIDNYNDFSGPVEVEQVVHTFSADTGFITQITPDLYNTISDLPTRTNIGAFGAYSYRWYAEHLGQGIASEYEQVTETVLQQQNQTGASIGFGKKGNIIPVSSYVPLALLAPVLLWQFPLAAIPLILGAYFLGGYLKDHATIHIVPLLHKGYPFVTGLHGFKAPETSDILLRQWRTFVKGLQKDWSAVNITAEQLLDPQSSEEAIRVAKSKMLD